MRPIMLFLTFVLPICAQNDRVYRVGNGVTAPRVTRKVDPEYSEQALRARIQGTAVYGILIDESGVGRDIEVISPVGYGLDERGSEAIAKWRFAPGMKDGMPEKIRATIEVNFRFPGILFDDAAETNRTKYNTALRDLKLEDRKGKALETFRSLAAKKYPPAMALLGEWKTKGQEGPKDVPGGIEMIRKAADRYDSGALFWLGKLYVDGEGVAADPDRGLKLIREASMYGSPGAQFYLGMKYGPQAGAVAEPERSRQYFRLCAARGTSLCQFYLGKMLIPAAGYKGDAVQALAWLELADGSVHEARDLAKSVRDTLTAEEIARAEKLKSQLVRD